MSRISHEYSLHRVQLDAVNLWLRTALESKAVTNSRNIDAFINFYWQLHSGTSERKVQATLLQLRKENGFLEDLPIATAVKVPNTILEPSDAHHQAKRQKMAGENPISGSPSEAGGAQEGISLLKHVPDSSATRPFTASTQPLCHANSTPTADCTTVKGKSRRKKRKAKNAQPSAENASPPEDSVRGTTQTARPYVACIDSRDLTPLSSDCEDAPPEPLPKQPIRVNIPLRASLPRRAARPDRLAETMSRETRYQNNTLSDDDFGHAPSATHSLSGPTLDRPTKKGVRKKRKTKKRGKVTNSAESSQAGAPTVSETVPVAAQAKEIPLQAEPPKSRTTSAQPKCSASKKTVSVKKPGHLVHPITKKPRMGNSKATQLERLLKEAAWAGANVLPASPSDAYLHALQATRTTRARKVKTAIDVGDILPVTTASEIGHNVPARSSRKRTREQLETDNPRLTIRIPAAKKKNRKVVPIPKGTRSVPQVPAPSVPQNALGDSASVVDAVTRNAAADALARLNCTTEAVAEWETDVPSAQLSHLEHDTEEDTPSSMSSCPVQGFDQPVRVQKLPLPGYPPIWSEVSHAFLLCDVLEAYMLAVETGSVRII